MLCLKKKSMGLTEVKYLSLRMLGHLSDYDSDVHKPRKDLSELLCPLPVCDHLQTSLNSPQPSSASCPSPEVVNIRSLVDFRKAPKNECNAHDDHTYCKTLTKLSATNINYFPIPKLSNLLTIIFI